MSNVRLRIEALEPRLAPAVTVVNPLTATFTDVDGDLVTVRVSKGVLSAGMFTTTPSGAGDQLQRIDLTGGECAGANLTITARRAGGGDGLVNVGHIDSTGHDLGNVAVDGDLGQFDAGDGVSPPGASRPDVRSLVVQSIGRQGLGTQGWAGSLESNIHGRLGRLFVRGDVVHAFIHGHTPSGDVSRYRTFDSITIGGSLIGGGFDNSGRIQGTSIGTVRVGGDVLGDTGDASGSIAAVGHPHSHIRSIRIGRELVGGSGAGSGSIAADGDDNSRSALGIGSIRVGAIQGGDGSHSGSVYVREGSLGRLAVTGFRYPDGWRADGTLSSGSGHRSGSIHAGDRIGTITVRDSIESHTSRQADGTPLGRTRVEISAGTSIGSLMVGRGGVDGTDILAGYVVDGPGGMLVPTNPDARIGSVDVGNTFTASNVVAGVMNLDRTFGTKSDTRITAPDDPTVHSRIGRVRIRGSAWGTAAAESGLDHFGIVAQEIGSLVVEGIRARVSPGAGNDRHAFWSGDTDLAALEVSLDEPLYRLGADGRLERFTTSATWELVGINVVKYVLGVDGRCYHIDQNGHWYVDGQPSTSGEAVQDVATRSDGVIYRLRTDRVLERLTSSGTWEVLGTDVRKFLIGPDGRCHHIDWPGAWYIDGVRTWSFFIDDLAVAPDGTLYAHAGIRVKQLAGGRWVNVLEEDYVQSFPARRIVMTESSELLILDADGKVWRHDGRVTHLAAEHTSALIPWQTAAGRSSAMLLRAGQLVQTLDGRKFESVDLGGPVTGAAVIPDQTTEWIFALRRDGTLIRFSRTSALQILATNVQALIPGHNTNQEPIFLIVRNGLLQESRDGITFRTIDLGGALVKAASVQNPNGPIISALRADGSLLHIHGFPGYSGWTPYFEYFVDIWLTGVRSIAFAPDGATHALLTNGDLKVRRPAWWDYRDLARGVMSFDLTADGRAFALTRTGLLLASDTAQNDYLSLRDTNIRSFSLQVDGYGSTSVTVVRHDPATVPDGESAGEEVRAVIGSDGVRRYLRDNRRVLYVNFDGLSISRGTLDYWGTDWEMDPHHLDTDRNGINVTAFRSGRSDREQVISRIMVYLRADLQPFGINVVRTRGHAPDDVWGSTTCFVGPSTVTAGSNVIGIAGAVDVSELLAGVISRNDNRHDICFAWGDIGEGWTTGSVEAIARNFAGLILHEAGHTWGLYHVNAPDDSNEVMALGYTVPHGRDVRFVDQSYPEYQSHGGGLGPQNSFAIMRSMFGYRV